jgi:hypothetical protein
MEKFDHTTGDAIKRTLKSKHGTLEKSAKVLKVSYHNLSRIINGKDHELGTHVKILIEAGLLPRKSYLFPREDMETFRKLNGIEQTKKART